MRLPIHVSRTTRALYGLFALLLTAAPVFFVLICVATKPGDLAGMVFGWVVTAAAVDYAWRNVGRLLARPYLLLAGDAMVIRYPALMRRPLQLSATDVATVFLTPAAGNGRHVRRWDGELTVGLAERTYQQLRPPVVRLGVALEQCTLAIVLTRTVPVTRPTIVVANLIERLTGETAPKVVTSLLLPMEQSTEVLALLSTWREGRIAPVRRSPAHQPSPRGPAAR